MSTGARVFIYIATGILCAIITSVIWVFVIVGRVKDFDTQHKLATQNEKKIKSEFYETRNELRSSGSSIDLYRDKVEDFQQQRDLFSVEKLDVENAIVALEQKKVALDSEIASLKDELSKLK